MNARHKALKRQLDESEEENSRLNHQIRKLKRDLDDVTEQVCLVASQQIFVPSSYIFGCEQTTFLHTRKNAPLHVFVF